MTRTKLINLGMFYMLLGAIAFSLMNTSLKTLSSNITINENMFFRGATMTIIVAFFVYLKSKRKKPHHHKKGGWGKLAFRAIVGTLSLYAMLYNIETIPLGTSVAFTQSAPIYTAIFAFIFLKEKMNIWMVFSVLIGFAGVLLISNPQTSNLTLLNVLCGILSAMFASLAFISIRALRGYFDDLQIMLSFGICATLLGAICVFLFQDSMSALGFKEWFFIILVGITGTIGQYYITRSYTYAPAAIVAPIDYTRILFSLIFGIVLGDALPNISGAVGMLFIIASGFLVASPFMLEEIKQRKKR